MNGIHPDGPYRLRLEAISSNGFAGDNKIVHTTNNNEKLDIIDGTIVAPQISMNIDRIFMRIEKALTLPGFIDSMTRRSKCGIENLAYTGNMFLGKDGQIREQGITRTLQSSIDNISSKILSALNSKYINSSHSSIKEIQS